MPAVTETGEAKVTCCQPLADSPAKVARASWVPVELHSVPTWVPMFDEPL